MTLRIFITLAVAGIGLIPNFGLGEENVVTLESVPAELEPIVADEPMAEEFSAAQAARYIDRAALIWQKKKKCATCHTNMGYLFARPALVGVQEDSGEVRDFYVETYL